MTWLFLDHKTNWFKYLSQSVSCINFSDMCMHVYSGFNDETENNNSSNILIRHLMDVSQERN